MTYCARYRYRHITNRPAISPLLLLVLLTFVSVYGAANDHSGFGYSGSHGPDRWAETYNTCVGKHQSPINIQEHAVREVNFPPLMLSGLDASRTFYLMNNGHTAQMYAPNGNHEEAFLSGGPLNGEYVFEQLHFHWGENDREGSEDLINNHSFAMELHAVFYNNQYGSLTNAVKYSDGLAVLAFFFETDADDLSNHMFDSIVEALPKIESVGTKIQLSETMRLKHLLDPAGPPKDRMQNYFTYNGSLTTPPCSEVVTWIDFKHPLYLSHAQIAAFRDISSSEGQKLTHNFRPVQPLEDRLVLHNSPKHAIITAENPASDGLVKTLTEIRNSGAPISCPFDLALMSVCLVFSQYLFSSPYNQR